MNRTVPTSRHRTVREMDKDRWAGCSDSGSSGRSERMRNRESSSVRRSGHEQRSRHVLDRSSSESRSGSSSSERGMGWSGSATAEAAAVVAAATAVASATASSSASSASRSSCRSAAARSRSADMADPNMPDRMAHRRRQDQRRRQLGHDQPEDVSEQTKIRNQSGKREKPAASANAGAVARARRSQTRLRTRRKTARAASAVAGCPDRNPTRHAEPRSPRRPTASGCRGRGYQPCRRRHRRDRRPFFHQRQPFVQLPQVTCARSDERAPDRQSESGRA